MTKIFGTIPLHIYRPKHAMFVWSLESILPLKSAMVCGEKWTSNFFIARCGFRVCFMTRSTCACQADADATFFLEKKTPGTCLEAISGCDG